MAKPAPGDAGVAVLNDSIAPLSIAEADLGIS